MTEPMKWSELSIIIATFLGPVFAIVVSNILQKKSDNKQRRLEIFRTLMATRRVGLSPEHVRALNLIEIEFYKNDNVISAWSNYLILLNTPQDINDAQSWYDQRDHLLATLLEKIAIELSYTFTSMQLFRGGYAPSAWQNLENLQADTLNALKNFSEGNVIIPIKIRESIETERYI